MFGFCFVLFLMIFKEIAKSQGLRAKKANNNDKSYKNGLLLIDSLVSQLCLLSPTVP